MALDESVLRKLTLSVLPKLQPARIKDGGPFLIAVAAIQIGECLIRRESLVALPTWSDDHLKVIVLLSSLRYTSAALRCWPAERVDLER